MKTIVIILLVAVTLSCTHTAYPEGELQKTKIYVGHYLNTTVKDGVCYIETDKCLVIIEEAPPIPDSAWCYVRKEECRYDYHPDIARQLERFYFSFVGGEMEYRMKNSIAF